MPSPVCAQCRQMNPEGLFYCTRCNAPLPGSAAYERQSGARTYHKMKPALMAGFATCSIAYLAIRTGMFSLRTSTAIFVLTMLLFLVTAVTYSVMGIKRR